MLSCGQVRGEGLVFVDGELWRARVADGSPLHPGQRVRVESVEQEGLELVVAPDVTDSAETERAPAVQAPAERT